MRVGAEGCLNKAATLQQIQAHNGYTPPEYDRSSPFAKSFFEPMPDLKKKRLTQGKRAVRPTQYQGPYGRH
jgi:hypothetical protein